MLVLFFLQPIAKGNCEVSKYLQIGVDSSPSYTLLLGPTRLLIS